MPEYLSPAVYIEERPGQQPIEAVGTSTTGFVGVTMKGPSAGKPTLVTSYAEFVDLFGGALGEPEPTLRDRWDFDEMGGGHWWNFAHSVRGFFDNGGRRLFIKRVLPTSATASSHTFGPMAINGPDSEKPSTPFTLVLPAGTPPSWTVTFFARDRGSWSKDSLQVHILPMRAHRVGAVKRVGKPLIGKLTATLAAGATSASVSYTDPDFVVGLTTNPVPVRIGGERLLAVITAGTPPAGTTPGSVTLSFTATGATKPTTTTKSGSAVQRLRKVSTANAADATKLDVEVTALKLDGKELLPNKALVLAGDTNTRFVVDSRIPNQPVVTLSPITTGDTADVYEGDHLSVIGAMVEVKFDGRLEEQFTGLGFHEDAPQNFANVINSSSRLVEVEFSNPSVMPDWDAFPGAAEPASLMGGADNLDTLTAGDFVGSDGGPGRRTGVFSFEDIEDIAICAAPGMWAAEISDGLMVHCDYMRNRFAVLDPPPRRNVVEVMAFRSSLSSKYAALYYPWLRVNTDDGVIEAAPSGHIAGLYGRIDNERGVHKAPANEVLRGIAGFADDISHREQELLNPIGINALRTFPNRGNRVWGARTLAAESEWRYVSVRRLFLNIEESIRRGTQWVVFEPNAEDLWARVRQSVSDFLDIVWRTGALEGVTREQAFYVKCDASTNTPADVAVGRLVVEIGIAPVKPAEFVIFRFHQKTRDQLA